MCSTLQVSDKKFEELVVSYKLNLLERAKLPGSTYSQRQDELDLAYHAHLYQEACNSAKSKLRAAQAEKQDVRFKGTRMAPSPELRTVTPPSIHNEQ